MCEWASVPSSCFTASMRYFARPSHRSPRAARQMPVSAYEAAVRLAAIYHLAAIRIERVVDDPLSRIVFMVVFEAEMPEAFGDSFQARSLRLLIQRVVGVGTVNDPPQQHQGRVASEFVLLQDCFERAFLT